MLGKKSKMIRAEWKKILRQKWFICIVFMLCIGNLFIYVIEEHTKHSDRIEAVNYFTEYQTKIEEMTYDEAGEYLLEQMIELSDFSLLQFALSEEDGTEILEMLLSETPDILENYKNRGYEERPGEVNARLSTISSMLRQRENIEKYNKYLENIQAQYEEKKVHFMIVDHMHKS